jgi:hypothetical protein
MIYAVGIRQEAAGAARARQGPRLTSAATGLRAFMVKPLSPDDGESPTFGFPWKALVGRQIREIRGSPNPAQYGLIRPNTALNIFTGHGYVSIQRFTGAPLRRKLGQMSALGFPAPATKGTFP